MKLVKLCEAAEVQAGEMIGVDLDGLPPLAVYNVDGTYYVTSNICTHAVARLSEGYLDDDIVECPFHGGSFNVRTGEPTHFPCIEPLPTYEVEVQDGAVFAKIA